MSFVFWSFSFLSANFVCHELSYEHWARWLKKTYSTHHSHTQMLIRKEIYSFYLEFQLYIWFIVCLVNPLDIYFIYKLQKDYGQLFLQWNLLKCRPLLKDIVRSSGSTHLYSPVALLGRWNRVNNRNGNEEEEEEKVASSQNEEKFERCVACRIWRQVHMGYGSSRYTLEIFASNGTLKIHLEAQFDCPRLHSSPKLSATTALDQVREMRRTLFDGHCNPSAANRSIFSPSTTRANRMYPSSISASTHLSALPHNLLLVSVINHQ